MRLRKLMALFVSVLLVPLLTASPAMAKGKGYERYAIGDLAAPTPGKVSGGLLLMGGGDRNNDAMRWFVEGLPSREGRTAHDIAIHPSHRLQHGRFQIDLAHQGLAHGGTGLVRRQRVDGPGGRSELIAADFGMEQRVARQAQGVALLASGFLMAGQRDRGKNRESRGDTDTQHDDQCKAAYCPHSLLFRDMDSTEEEED